MKKNLIRRCLVGAPIGISISFIIAIIISVIINKGEFYPVDPQFSQLCGGELNAVIIQSVSSMIYGAIMAGASVIWEVDNWSLLKQTVVHCLVISLATLPIAFFMHWMPHNVLGAVVYFAIFFAIYFIIWISLYLSIKRKIQALDKKVKEELA